MVKLSASTLKAATVADKPLPQVTRSTTVEPWISELGQALIDGKATVEDEDGNEVEMTLNQVEIRAQDDPKFQDLVPGTETWLQVTKSRMGRLSNYIRNHFKTELEDRGLYVSTQYVRDDCFLVMVKPSTKVRASGSEATEPTVNSVDEAGE